MRRLGALAYRHPVRVLLVAASFFAAAVVLGAPIVSLLRASPSDFEDPASQNARVTRLLQRATGAEDEFGVVALMPTGADGRTSPSAQRQEARVAALLARQKGFLRVVDYVRTRDPQLVSRNRHETVVLATFTSGKLGNQAIERLRPQLRAERVAFGGLDPVYEELTRHSRVDLERAELLALPLLLALSLWVFRGLVAALLPLLIGGLTIFGTFLFLRIVDQLTGLSVFALNLVTALGLGLAIDYSLFVLSRYREELANDRRSADRRSSNADTGTAIGRTLQTAGRTVLYSSLTVGAALAALTVFPLRFLYSMGIAGTLTALTAGAVSLIVLPAILVLLGPRIDALAPAWLRRSSLRASRPQAGGFWFRFARVVMRRPGAIALASAALLVTAGSPVLRIALTPAGASLLPTSSQTRQVNETVMRDFATDAALRIAAVIQAPPSAGKNVEAYARQAARLSGEPVAGSPRYLGRSTWEVAIPPRGDPNSAANESLVKRLRALAAPFPVAVGGITAWFMDQQSSLGSHLPVVLVILALTMFSALFAMTGSVVLPLKALLMNMLTLSAAAGALVLAFQDGRLGGLLDFRGNGGLEPSNLVLLLTIAFALSTDYGVFLLARIKEARDAGLPNREAIALGLERTGRLVTAAALLFCVAVGALVTSQILFIKELGFGAALAVAIDASIVRALLVPSLMALLGDWNWWAPRWMRRLHPGIAVAVLGDGREPDGEATHSPSGPES
jgi:uncharacterized membrane protein YdfJ with MMPL/SSD domain